MVRSLLLCFCFSACGSVDGAWNTRAPQTDTLVREATILFDGDNFSFVEWIEHGDGGALRVTLRGTKSEKIATQELSSRLTCDSSPLRTVSVGKSYMDLQIDSIAVQNAETGEDEELEFATHAGRKIFFIDVPGAQRFMVFDKVMIGYDAAGALSIDEPICGWRLSLKKRV